MEEHKLNPTERRVVAVLIEKSLSQPDYYPMTSNAIVAACNQRHNRHPVMELEEETVLETLERLRRYGLVSLVLPAPGARVSRYKHEAEKVWGWNKRQQAIMTELLLRGPQTPGELRSRCTRMFPIESLEAVTIALESLARPESGPPMVAALPREPGQSAIRYTHLLYPEDETPPPATSSSSGDTGPLARRDSELESLRREITSLKAELAELRRRLETIEARTTPR